MGTGHMRCTVCRVATVHKTTRFGMCPRHEQEYIRKRRAARMAAKRTVLEEGPVPKLQPKADKSVRPTRFEIKALQDAVEAAAPVIDALVDASPESGDVEDATSNEVVKEMRADWREAMQRRIDAMPDERKLEIGTHYENPAIPTKAIQLAYGMSGSMLAMLISQLGIPPRTTRGGRRKFQPGHFDMEPGGKFVWVVEDVPAPQRKALENMLKLPAQAEPVLHSTPLPDNLPDPRPATRLLGFEVTVSGTFQVAGLDMMSAMQRVLKDYPNLRITGIVELG